MMVGISEFSGGEALNILVTGSTGLIGSKLCAVLEKNDHRVLRMVRRIPAQDNEVKWDPDAGRLDKSDLGRLDAAVHLAGESIASGRWTVEKRRRIRQSRTQGTTLLAQSLADLPDPPRVLISASAVGYYGNRGEEQLDEESGSGKGFLPEVCREWESATAPAAKRGIRVVIPRVGMVLSATGGAFALMLPIYRLGIGGKIGSGQQYMSWIAIDDMVGIINHALNNSSLQGPVNAVSPNPVTNLEFSKTLARLLSRPAIFCLPAFAARLVFGKMADEVLLSSSKVAPTQLIVSGYKFAFPKLDGALRHILNKPIAQG
jgi:uncharacterized protein (TIGR01777 family)